MKIVAAGMVSQKGRRCPSFGWLQDDLLVWVLVLDLNVNL